MKPTCLIFIAAFSSILSGLQAANLTGEGYIYITKPTTAWTPPSGVYNTPRFLWYPDKAALRFGDLESGTSTLWDNSNIGTYSFAAGLNTEANGHYSFAFGEYALANGNHSIALGSQTFSFSAGTALGYGSMVDSGGLAAGGGWAGFPSTIALGWSVANASESIAIGCASGTNGESSIAIGVCSYSAGRHSISIGELSETIADYSIAIGSKSYSASKGGVALGMNTLSKRMNGSNSSPGTAQADDPVFMVSQAELGTEPGDTATANALTIFRNGAAHFNGVVRVKAGGDISMGAYTAKPSGVSFP